MKYNVQIKGIGMEVPSKVVKNKDIEKITPDSKAEWIKDNCDFDQLILEYFNREEKNAGWIHVSYNEKGKNRKAVLTFDGKTYENGLPEMKYSFDKSGNEVIS